MSRRTNELDAVFATLKTRMGPLDFLVHAIAYSDKNELKGRYVDTTRANFARTHGDFLLFLHRGRAARRAADDAATLGGTAAR